MIENTTNFWQQNIASTIAHSRYLMSQIFDGDEIIEPTKNIVLAFMMS